MQRVGFARSSNSAKTFRGGPRPVRSNADFLARLAQTVTAQLSENDRYRTIVTRLCRVVASMQGGERGLRVECVQRAAPNAESGL